MNFQIAEELEIIIKMSTRLYLNYIGMTLLMNSEMKRENAESLSQFVCKLFLLRLCRFFWTDVTNEPLLERTDQDHTDLSLCHLKHF